MCLTEARSGLFYFSHHRRPRYGVRATLVPSAYVRLGVEIFTKTILLSRRASKHERGNSDSCRGKAYSGTAGPDGVLTEDLDSARGHSYNRVDTTLPAWT